MKGFPSSSEVKRIRDRYPVGTLIRCDNMEGPYPIEPGTIGIVAFVDDAGQIHMNWETGRSLALIPDVDMFTVL